MSLNKSKALRTAEKYVLQGKIPSAIEEYRKVVEADPSDLTTINTLGDLYVRAGRIQDAILNFSRIAESYRESGFTLKAIAMLKKISKLDPTNVETSMKLANLYSQQGLLVEARQQYLQVADAFARAGQTRRALEAYQKIADLDPSNTAVRMKLGEIYSRERMVDQAHEMFIMAGAEFQRKGDMEQALNANLKAIAINPDSRQGLTAIATIYTQLGQADRAINILCDAFEKNPGDVELLTILGRTYLSAGLMDDAERTFLSLVELDRNRYHYLLEVGRQFLQLGDLDRASEQIDGCLDVLISKREEDKAIDFLRRILDRDMNHIGSLKRLAQIFQRIREDHNLIATLNSLAEAAMRKGADEQAIAALTELAHLEPDEPMHRQRLYNLGVRDIAEPDSSDVVRATGPLDYESAAFDDAFVIRQISEAEILAGHGQVDHAVTMLKEILNHASDNVQVHLKLKDIYLRAGVIDSAASQCVELARIYDARGEASRANDFIAEAQQLNPFVDIAQPQSAHPERAGWSEEDEKATGLEGRVAGTPSSGAAGFEMREATGGLDLTRYQTGPLTDESGFVTVPREGALSGDFVYGGREPAGSDMSGSSDRSIPPGLAEELDGVDFYLAQGYTEIARDTLDRLGGEYGDHPEIAARLARLGVEAGFGPAERSSGEVRSGINGGKPDSVTIDVGEGANAPGEESDDMTVTVSRGPKEAERQNAMPFLVTKESGPLQPDLIVKFNTSELLSDTAFDLMRQPTGALTPPPEEPVPGDLMESLASTIDTSFARGNGEAHGDESASAGHPSDYVTGSLVEAGSNGGAEAPGNGKGASRPAQPGGRKHSAELQHIFEELRESTGELRPLSDYETHYSLGLAYKDMDLLDEAIEQFQLAFRRAGEEDLLGSYSECCHMLGVCFKRKGMLKVAVMWFERGLKIPDRAEDEYQALRYEVAVCYEEMGEVQKAVEAYMEVYGVDVNYREVSDKIKQLQAL